MVCFLQPKHEDGARHEPTILCCHAPEPEPDQAKPPASTISVLVFGNAMTQGREREQGEVVGWPVFRREALVVWRYRRRARWESRGWGRRRDHNGFRVLPVRAWPDGTGCSRPASSERISCVESAEASSPVFNSACGLGTSAADTFRQWGESGFARNHQDKFVLGGRGGLRKFFCLGCPLGLSDHIVGCHTSCA